MRGDISQDRLLQSYVPRPLRTQISGRTRRAVNCSALTTDKQAIYQILPSVMCSDRSFLFFELLTESTKSRSALLDHFLEDHQLQLGRKINATHFAFEYLLRRFLAVGRVERFLRPNAYGSWCVEVGEMGSWSNYLNEKPDNPQDATV